MLFKVVSRMKSDKRGFTIPELLVTLVIMGLVAVLIGAIAGNIYKRYKLVEDRYVVQTEVKAIADAFTADASTGSLATATKVDLFYQDPDELMSNNKFTCCPELGEFTVHTEEWTATATGSSGETTSRYYPANSLEFSARNPSSADFDETNYQYAYLFVYDDHFYVLNSKSYVATRFSFTDEVMVNIEYTIAVDAFKMVENSEGKWVEGDVYDRKTTKPHEYLHDGLTVTVSSGDDYDFDYSLMTSFALKNYTDEMCINYNNDDGTSYLTNAYVAGYSFGNSCDNYPGTKGTSDPSFDKIEGTCDHLDSAATVIRYISLTAFNSGQVSGNSGSTSTGFGCATSFLMVGTDIGEGVKNTLRNFRDTTLKGNALGDLIIKKYYEWSPAIIEFTSEHEGAKKLLKSVVTDIAYIIEIGK